MPLLPRFLDTRIEDERRIAKAVLDGQGVEQQQSGAKRTGNRSGEGDPRRLRGIPCIAHNVGGTSPGTNPVAELLRSDRHRRYAS